MPEEEARLRGWYDTSSKQPDRHITALPFLPAPATPVKEQNTGAIYSSSPSHGMVRVKLEEVGDLCLGDSIEYSRGEAAGVFCGRVIGLVLSEELDGLAARVRRLLTREEVLHECRQWSSRIPTGSGLWETSWEDTVALHMITQIVSVRTGGEGDMVLKGTINDYGDCAQPYRCLASWEAPWRAEGGCRTEPMKKMLANMEKELPTVTLSISEWWDSFQTFRHGQVGTCTRTHILVHLRYNLLSYEYKNSHTNVVASGSHR